MSVALIVPGLIVVFFAFAAGLVSWSVTPRVAMRALATVALLAGVTVFGVVLSLAIGFAAQWSPVPTIVERCARLMAHHRVGTAEGMVAVVALAAVTVRLQRVVRIRRWAAAGTAGRHLAILETSEPIAYAAPGKPGCVVVSRGLLAGLRAHERKILFAHERAHLTQNHHRYLLIGAMAQAVVPILGRLVRQLQLATERCADEAAVAATGGDRRAVAVAIGRAALVTSAFGGTVGSFGGGSIPTRVDALMGEPRRGLFEALAVVAAMLAVGAVVASSLQMHHLYRLVAHVCGS